MFLVLIKEFLSKIFSGNFIESLYLRPKVICFGLGFSTLKETCTSGIRIKYKLAIYIYSFYKVYNQWSFINFRIS